LWDAILPPSELLVLPAELGRVDGLLHDPVFFAPFAAYFDVRMGRPSIPVETYLRLMFLKFRYRLGYESLCREVADFDFLAAVLPDSLWYPGAAPDHADEDHHPVRRRCGRRA
jgi:IS5 family transposase